MGCKGITGLSWAGSWRAMATVLIHLLIASVAFGAARRFDDQPCQPRPQVIKLEDKNGHPVRPYHILLYRCGGTCDKMSPQRKPCSVKSEKSIPVMAQTEAGEEITVEVANHTSCLCACKLDCDFEQGELPNKETCQCRPPPGEPGALGGGKGEENQDTLPFIIGMALVGFFAVCVLVFDAIMCGKGFGVMHTIKTGCCSRRDRSSHCNSCSPKSPTHDVTSL